MVHLLKVGVFVYRKRGLEYPMPENCSGAHDLKEESKYRFSPHTGRHTKKRHTQISLSYEKRPSFCQRKQREEDDAARCESLDKDCEMRYAIPRQRYQQLPFVFAFAGALNRQRLSSFMADQLMCLCKRQANAQCINHPICIFSNSHM
jgi:hypothetical protein